MDLALNPSLLLAVWPWTYHHPTVVDIVVLCPDSLLKAGVFFFQLLGISLLIDGTRRCSCLWGTALLSAGPTSRVSHEWLTGLLAMIWEQPRRAIPALELPSDLAEATAGQVHPLLNPGLLTSSQVDLLKPWAANYPFTTLWVCVQEPQFKTLSLLGFSSPTYNMGIITVPAS